MFSKYDKEMQQIMVDPVKWARHHLGGDEPRWYQEEILRHPHNRKVLRCGRRIGKCIEGSQRVMDPKTGRYRSVEDLFKLQKEDVEVGLLTLNESYKLEPSTAFFVEDNGVKEVFRVKTKHGAEVLLTGNHPVLTINGWVEVDLLEVGEHIAVPNAVLHEGKDIAPVEARLMGLIVAGGRLIKGRLYWESRFEEVAEYMASMVEQAGGTLEKVEKRKQSYRVRFEDEALEKKMMVIAKEAREGKMPAEVFEYDRLALVEFITGLYDVAGWDYAKRITEIGYGTPHHAFAIDLKHLLLRLGVKVNLLKKQVNGGDYYHLMIYYREHVQHLIRMFRGVGSGKNYDHTYNRAGEMAATEYVLPKDVWPHIEKERREKKLKKTEVTGSKKERLRPNHGITFTKARTYAENMQSAFLWDLVNADVLWEEVVEIESVGKRQTYDVFVPETHNLVVEDIIVHNTWTMTAHMLWVAYTCNGGTELKKGATCLVATPYDTQAREIFDQLNNFIENNDALKASVASIRRSPYEIVFHNKSRIKLYTAGTRSGAEGGSLRGQKASWLYLDEVDYLGDKDFEAIYAISMEAPKRIGVMMASTPTGRRGKFYQACVEMRFNQDEKVVPIKTKDGKHFDVRNYDRDSAKGWKEFHFPTMVNPEWSPEMESEMKQMYTNAAYEHEVLAEFGTEEAGVFNKDYIDEASSNGYGYLSRRTNDAPIAIGVDWDKAGAATQIVVTQWDNTDPRRPIGNELDDILPGFGRFKVINRVEIPRGEYTYDNAVNMLKELDRVYNPFAIYVDKGAGDYQSEVLRKSLGEKVRAVAFGSSEIVRDPISRTLDKKPMKAFMVSIATFLLDRGQLRIPSKEVDETLNRQMTNYQIMKIAPKTGEPTFSSTDEHALDAFMLTLYAFNTVFPELAKAIEGKDVARTFSSMERKYVDPMKGVFSQGFSGGKQAESWDEPGGPPPKRVGLRSKKRKGKDGWGERGERSSFRGRSHF